MFPALRQAWFEAVLALPAALTQAQTSELVSSSDHATILLSRPQKLTPLPNGYMIASR